MTGPPPPRADRTGAAQQRFEAAAIAAGLNPANRWIDGYAAYEWEHLRHALDAYAFGVEGRDVIEFGCNAGGSSVVLAALGARVSGVDVDPDILPVAEANLARHGFDGDIRLIKAGGGLPFADASFDLAVANSVLEYVEPQWLDHSLAELHRVLRPGGRMLILGTASRLALRERHSGAWLVNFMPRAVDRLLGRDLQRGLAPWSLAAALSGRFTPDSESRPWLATRHAIHGKRHLHFRAFAILGNMIGRSPGWFTPFIELSLRKT